MKKYAFLSTVKYLPYCFCVCLLLLCACKKNDDVQLVDKNKMSADIDYISNVKKSLADSLSASLYDSIDFGVVLKSKKVSTANSFLRLGFKDEPMKSKFVLLETDSAGLILKGKIVRIKRSSNSTELKEDDVVLEAKSFDGEITVFKSTQSMPKTNSMMEEDEEPAGEQTLPGVIVISYTETQPTEWYVFDIILGGGGSGDTYTYGDAGGMSSGGAGSGGSVKPDKTMNVSYENADKAAIELAKFLKCFSNLPDDGSSFQISIFADIPVNGDPSVLFDYSTGACGHAFIQFHKQNGTSVIQQTIGFYPQSGWKSIEANGPVASKVCDNAGHEWNASLTINVTAQEFTRAMNEASYEAKGSYDIDNFNCTDFALNVFNSAATDLLEIPQYSIPGSMLGELSNTPQGLYTELVNLNRSGYGFGEITIPGIAGFTGSSHGACD